MSKFDVVASIVIYNNPKHMLQKVVNSYLSSDLSLKLCLVDNSEKNTAKDYFKDPRIDYIFLGNNIGFGAAHNIAIEKYCKQSNYYAILNPDIYFDDNLIKALVEKMNKDPNIGVSIPKIVNEDGSIQRANKRLPGPLNFFFRMFFKNSNFFKKIFKKQMDLYELRDMDSSKDMECPSISGCFMFTRSSSLQAVGLFDDRFFMYFEDIDLSRRLSTRFKSVIFSDLIVYHSWGRGIHTSLKPFFYSIKSLVLYFNKYGWFFDKERKKLNQIKYYE